MNNTKIPDMTAFSSFARPLDPFNYRTNLYILIMTAVCGAIAGAWMFLSSGDFAGAIFSGIYTGAAVFISWVLARDVDPENDWSAFVCSGIAFVFCAGRVDILPLAVAVFFLRMVSRVVGPPAKITDSLLTLGMVGATVFTGYWTFGIVAIVAFAIDGTLNKPLRTQWVFAGLSAFLTLGGLLIIGANDSGYLGFGTLFLMLIALGLGTFAFIQEKKTRILADNSLFAIEPARLRACLVILALMGIGGAFQFGDSGFYGLISVWAVLAGVGAYQVYLRLRPTKRK